MTKYGSPWSVGNRKQIVIDQNDPRTDNLNIYKSKAGSKVIINKSFDSPLELEEYVNEVNFVGWGNYYNPDTGETGDRFGYSYNGVDWFYTTAIGANRINMAQAAGNGIYLIFKQNIDVVFISTDGINWDQVKINNWPIYSYYGQPYLLNLNSLTYGNGRFVGVSYDNSVSATSTDGINWTFSGGFAGPPRIGFVSVSYGNGYFVASGEGSQYSTDGINWSLGSSPDGPNAIAVYKTVYGNNKFVALSSYDPNEFNPTYAPVYSLTYYSENHGISWNKIFLPKPVLMTDIAYGNGKFVIITNTNEYAISSDAITWTFGDLPRYQEPGFPGGNGSDGLIWHEISYSNGKFVIQGDYTQAYSTNGIDWVKHNTLSSLHNISAM